ncbi:hypothetical protein MCUN1_000659 [Malassezia cuniculi]|uniref:Partial AB-hydrolase lipase domain-containing protein n=1 Tax=Malassezia cuniculi TaxID=948313 RepID=A0AAF0J5V5_9BASI|nr:hypothetical protein MCUN1_000659 [Malassezia cuniculi]
MSFADDETFRHTKQLDARVRPHEHALPRPTSATFRFWVDQTIAVILSSVILISLVIIGLIARFVGAIPRMLTRRQELVREWDRPELFANEKLVKDMRYYAQECGFDLEDHTVTTQDGYYLRLQRVVPPNETKKGYPVLLMHGLFQSSGSFVTSEERSLAFWLASQGYTVYLGNNRGIFDMGHREYSRWDPRFWDYTIQDLAQYDVPALVDYVCRDASSETLAYIGHSQGNAILFLALHSGIVPDIGKRISYFCALAPAAYTGPLVSRFPLKYLAHVDKHRWVKIFGVMDFVPLMKFSYDWTPARPYAALGYQMFAFLFDWNDTHWLLRRKPKMFRFTPQPVSSETLYWWAGMGGFAARGCILDEQEEQWFEEDFPPVALYAGGNDKLVDVHRLPACTFAQDEDRAWRRTL